MAQGVVRNIFVSENGDGLICSTHALAADKENGISYKDSDLEEMVEGALKQTDKNNDGYIEYSEFRAATDVNVVAP